MTVAPVLRHPAQSTAFHDKSYNERPPFNDRRLRQLVDPVADPSMLVVNVQIAVRQGTPAADRAVALARRLQAMAEDDMAPARVSTSVAIVIDSAVPVPAMPFTPAARPPAGPPPAPTAPAGTELVLFPERRVAVLDGQPIDFTRREFDLLLHLIEHGGRVLSRSQLLGQVWGYPYIGGERTVDVHVRRLRAKLNDRGPSIRTVRGVGYRLDELQRVAVVRDGTY